MRILIVSQYFWPESFRINDLVKTLVEKDVEVDVLTGKPNYPEGRIFSSYRIFGCQNEIWYGANVFRIPLFPRGESGALKLAINYVSFIVSGLFFGPWLLKERRYDVIFVYGVSPIFQAIPAHFLGWVKKIPVIIWVQDLWPESLSATGYVKNPWLLKKIGLMVSFVYRRADLLLVQSSAFIPFVSALAFGKVVQYFPNSVNDSFGTPSTNVTPDIPALEQGFPVVFAGNIGAGQAVDVIVEAANMLKDHSQIRFIVIGQGSRRDWMLEQVKSLGLTNLHLPGRYPVESMPDLMLKAGALLVSLSDESIFAATVPNKLQAYLASGRPIIASLNGEGARMINEAQAGLTCPAGDAKALAEAVVRLSQMTAQERSILGRNGQSYFKTHFDHNMLTDQLINHIKMVVEDYRSKK